MNSHEQLVSRYEKAEKELIAIIAEKEAAGSVSAYYKSRLRQIQRVLSTLRKETPALVKGVVADGYREGLSESRTDSSTRFSAADNRVVDILELNMIAELNQGMNLVGRRMKDTLRAAALEAAAKKTMAGKTVRDMRKSLIVTLTGAGDGVVDSGEGRLGVRYRNGRIMPLSKYAGMVSRTTTAEAATRADFQRGEEWGHDLASCTTHDAPCHICAMYAGRTFALTREAANGKYYGLRFPYLYETALRHGYHVIHPNCKHAFTSVSGWAYTEAELTKMSEFSTRPFEDNRTEQERQAYAKDQTEKRQLWEDNKLFEKVRAVLPDDSYSTFAGFRNGKLNNSERFQELIKDYRYIVRESKKNILTEDEEYAVKRYISAEAYTLNGKLRTGEALTENEETLIKQLDNALEKMPKYEGTVYRSITTDEKSARDILGEYLTGEIVSHPSYFSSGKDVYDETMSVQYVIKSKAGRDISGYNPNEKEVLFERDTVFRVEKILDNTIWLREEG